MAGRVVPSLQPILCERSGISEPARHCPPCRPSPAPQLPPCSSSFISLKVIYFDKRNIHRRVYRITPHSLPPQPEFFPSLCWRHLSSPKGIAAVGAEMRFVKGGLSAYAKRTPWMLGHAVCRVHASCAAAPFQLTVSTSSHSLLGGQIHVAAARCPQACPPLLRQHIGFLHSPQASSLRGVLLSSPWLTWLPFRAASAFRCLMAALGTALGRLPTPGAAPTSSLPPSGPSTPTSAALLPGPRALYVDIPQAPPLLPLPASCRVPVQDRHPPP